MPFIRGEFGSLDNTLGDVDIPSSRHDFSGFLDMLFNGNGRLDFLLCAAVSV